MEQYERDILFSRVVLPKMVLKNRIVMAPVPTGFIENRIPTNKNIVFYGERAKSVGLIIAGVINIDHETAPNHEKTPNIHTEQEIDAWKNITDAVHFNNGKIIAQIWHSGGYRKFCINNEDVTTPSGIVNNQKIGIPMSKFEIENIIFKFAETALNAKKAGFDGVEIHGAHGGLIHDFFCPENNKRTDEYGIENRTLFAEKIISECRKVVGELFPIFFRISNFKMYDLTSKLANSPEEFEKFIFPLSNIGVDIFDCSSLCFTDSAFSGYYGSLAYWTKKYTNKPTINVGCVGSEKPFITETSTIIQKISERPEALSKEYASNNSKLFNGDVLCSSIKNEEFDLIAVGRPLLKDANWLNKI